MTNVRKVRMTMPYGTPMVVIKNPAETGGKIDPVFIFSLSDFEYKDGNMRWVIDTPEGGIVTGGIGDMELKTIPNHGTVSVALSIPVTLHMHSPTFSPEFIILIPEHLRVYPLPQLKKKYGTGTSNNLFR